MRILFLVFLSFALTLAAVFPRTSEEPLKQPLKCYVGFYDKAEEIDYGAEVYCDGYCASVTSVIGENGQNLTSFHCAPRSACEYLGLDNSQTTLYLDRAVTIECCDVADNCNTVGFDNINTTMPVVKEKPITCYSGILWNGVEQTSGGGWTTCRGDCVSVSLNMIYLGDPTVISVYSCYPKSMCDYLALYNSCNSHYQENTKTCCCNFDRCQDPTV